MMADDTRGVDNGTLLLGVHMALLSMVEKFDGELKEAATVANGTDRSTSLGRQVDTVDSISSRKSGIMSTNNKKQYECVL